MRVALSLCLIGFDVAAAAAATAGCDSRPYSGWMADSVIGRGQAVVTPGASPSASTYLQVGFFQTAILRLRDYYKSAEGACAESNWDNYLRDSSESVAPYLLSATEDTKYPLDRLSTGRGLLHQVEQEDNKTAKNALDELRESINLQPRNQYGGYWYYNYPDLSYLDGAYSLVPFLSYYTSKFDSTNSTAVTDDIINQIDLFWSHCRQDDSGLLVHGYDASKKSSWADPTTGGSPIVWGRALGWFLMSLVDTLDELEPNFPPKLRTYLQDKFVDLANAVSSAADADSGCWWQALNFPGRQGNYIESSGSAMFTYALYKGARLNLLPSQSRDAADKCRGHLEHDFVDKNRDGTLGYNGTVAVCSLSSPVTYEYYTSQPLQYNSVHGSTAFILASLEHEMIQYGQQ